MCEVLQHNWYLEDLWYIRTQSNRLLKHSILMVWRTETMRGVLGTVGSMFSLRFATLTSKILSFFSKFYTHPAFFFKFWALICHSALMVPFQMCNCTAPDALTHRERHRREDMTLMFSKRNFTFLTTEQFSNFSGIIRRRHHFFIMFLYDLIFLWPSINF